MPHHEAAKWRKHRQRGQRRYVDRYTEFAQDHFSPKQEDFQAIEIELANISTAIAVARKNQDWKTIIRLVYVLLEGSLRVRGYWEESIKYGSLLLEAAEKVGDRRAAGWAWTSAIGWIEIQRGNTIKGREAVEEGLRAFQEAGSQWGTWQARRHLGQAYRSADDLQMAREIFLAALRNAQTAYSNRWPTVHLLSQYLRFIRRNWGREKWTWRTFIETRQSDYESIVAHYYYELGGLEQQAGRLSEARRYYEEALELFGRLEQETDICAVLVGLAHVARKEKAWDEARELYLRSLSVNQAYQVQISLADAYFGLAEVELAQGQTEKAEHYGCLAHNIYLGLGVDIDSVKKTL